MNRGWRFALQTLAVAVVVHFSLVIALPGLIMQLAMRGVSNQAGINQLFHAPLADASSRGIVRPSPDLAYSICVFDLSEGPVQIFTPDSAGYMSLSLFSAETDNFFVLNDRQIESEGVELLLVSDREPVRVSEKIRVVRSPSNRGILLFRYVVEDEEHFAELDRVRRLARCEPASS